MRIQEENHKKINREIACRLDSIMFIRSYITLVVCYLKYYCILPLIIYEKHLGLSFAAQFYKMI